MLRIVLFFLIFLQPIFVPPALADARMELPAQAVQGALVTGRVPPGSTVRFAGRTLRVSEEGWFVFGLGREHGPEAELHARFPDGSRHQARIQVETRRWRIERVDGLPPSTVSPDPELARRIAREQAQVSTARDRDDDRLDFLQAFQWPVSGRVSGVYGSQRILNGEPRNPHYGLDVAAPTGTPVRAPAAGVVILAEPDFYLTGGTLTLDHGHGVSSTFIHLSRIDRAVGDRVEQGEVLGAVGATGRATGPHMHWGMNWFDTRIDPQLLLPEH
ncbi:MAG: M23 family metallopeptidase [Xanthomonadales bacterium]|nr:M23 family metallopeptidase [Xanthomonadales bacterium]